LRTSVKPFARLWHGVQAIAEQLSSFSRRPEAFFKLSLPPPEASNADQKHAHDATHHQDQEQEAPDAVELL
jgi:hypothetical protein